MVFLSEKAKDYFKKEQEKVFSWWNPENDDLAVIYKHGLGKVTEELSCYKGIKYILDVGCGKGRVTKALFNHYNVVSIDISQRMVDYVKNLNLPNVKVLLGESESLPLEKMSMDAVICLEALVHFPNLDKVFSEFHRVLKPGGACIVDIDSTFGYIRLLKRIVDGIIYFFDRNYKQERQKRSEFFKTISSNDLQEVAQNNGFILFKKVYIGVIVPFKFKNKTIISKSFFKYIFSINKILEKVPILRLGSTYVYYVFRKK